MNEVLKIEVQAQVAQAQAALRQLQTSLKGTEQAAGGVTNQMPKLGQSTNGANVALVNFGRVVQDAPFGLIGIANNIDPLLTSFQQLKQQTGSTSAAFKALASSLAGPAGIAIAVSAITSAFIAFGPELKSLVSGSNDFAEAFKESSGEVSKTAVEVFALVNAVKSGTLSTNELKAAQKQLVKENPEFRNAFKNGKIDVDALNNALDDTVQKLLTAIKVSAASKILEKEFAKIAETILAAGENLSSFQRLKVGRFGAAGIIRSNLEDANTKLLNFNKRVEEVLNKLGVAGSNFVKTTDEGLDKDKKKIKNQVDLLRSYREELRLLNFQETALGISNLNEKIKLSSETLNGFIKVGLKETSKEFIFINSELNKFLNQSIQLQQTLQKVGEQSLIGLDIKDAVPNLQKLVNLQKEFNASGLPERATRTSTITPTFEALLATRNAQIEQENLNKNLEITNQLINQISGEFGALFASIANDGVKSFKDIAKAIAETTTQILIQYAVTTALKALLNTLTAGIGGNIADVGSKGVKGVVRGRDLGLILGRLGP